MVEVRIPASLLTRFGSEVHANVRILEKLRDKGIPALGAISIIGVKSGRLTTYTDNDSDDVVYEWDGTVEEDEEL